MHGMMDSEGDGYRPDNGAFDDLISKPKGTMSVDLSTIKGMDGYRPGDVVELTVKARIPRMNSDNMEGDGESDGDEGGMTDLEIMNITAGEMDRGVNLTRQREKNMEHLRA
jgi:hypothetical protein